MAAGSAGIAQSVPVSLSKAAGFDGPGIYFYPAWGRPKPYLVVLAADAEAMLEFRDPLTEALLWRQSLTLARDFAGKVLV